MSTPWYEEFMNRFGPIPDSYVVVDVETTGLSFKHDLIIQSGIVVVSERQATAAETTVLDWTSSPLVDQSWLRSQLANVRKYTGDCPQFTYDYLTSEGVDPVGALTNIRHIFGEAQSIDIPIVAHNGLRFDIPLFQTHFWKFLNESFKFEDHQIWDTGYLEKASQLKLNPIPGETLRKFFNRSSAIMLPGLSWSLSETCAEKYGLFGKLKEAGIAPKFHDAGVDAYATHFLLEAIRLSQTENT